MCYFLIYRAVSFWFTLPSHFPQCHFSSDTGFTTGSVSHLTQTEGNVSSQAHSSGFNWHLEQRSYGNELVQKKKTCKSGCKTTNSALCFPESCFPTDFQTSRRFQQGQPSFFALLHTAAVALRKRDRLQGLPLLRGYIQKYLSSSKSGSNQSVEMGLETAMTAFHPQVGFISC